MLRRDIWVWGLRIGLHPLKRLSSFQNLFLSHPSRLTATIQTQALPGYQAKLFSFITHEYLLSMLPSIRGTCMLQHVCHSVSFSTWKGKNGQKIVMLRALHNKFGRVFHYSMFYVKIYLRQLVTEGSPKWVASLLHTDHCSPGFVWKISRNLPNYVALFSI